MSIHDHFEREEQALCDALNRGEITQQEFDRAMRELQHELRSYAEERANSAYNDAMGWW